MTTKTETAHRGAFLISEAPGERSREQITLLSGQSVNDGAVLGKSVTAGTIAAGTIQGTGNGTIGTLSVAANKAAKIGIYRVTFIEPATNLGTFVVEDPYGKEVGKGVVGTEFSGEIVFTIADGSTDFVAGDYFLITVSQLTFKWLALDPTAATGAEVAAGIAYGSIDATSADTLGIAVVRDAEVNTNDLAWSASISATNLSLGKARLLDQGIVVRT